MTCTALLVTLLFGSFPTHAEHKRQLENYQPKITKQTGILSTMAGLITGILTTCGLEMLAEKAGIDGIYGQNPWTKAIIGGASGFVGYIGMQCIYNNQPEGLFQHAQKCLNNLHQNNNINIILGLSNPLFNIDTIYSAHTYPRVACYNELIEAYNRTQSALEQLCQVCQRSADQELIDVANEHAFYLEAYYTQINKVLILLKNDPIWIEQMKAYQAYLAWKAYQDHLWQIYLSGNSGIYHNHCGIYPTLSIHI